MLRLALLHGCSSTAADYAEAVRRVRGVQFTAVVHGDEATRKDSAAALVASVSAASFDELLKSDGDAFDAVLIRGAVSRRAEIAGRAAAAKKHVCLTTPAAASEAEVDRIAAACQTAGVTLMIGSRRQFQPAIAAVKSALDSGKLGSPALLRLHHWLPLEPEKKAAQTVNERSSGPIWSEIVSHLHLALWTFGNSPTELFASGRGSQNGERNWPDYLQLHLGFPDGGMALISLAFDLPPGDGYDVFTVIGSTGAAYADDHPQRQLVFRGDAPKAVLDHDDILTRTAQLRTFAIAIAENAKPPTAIHDMKSALRLADAAWTSLQEHRPVRVEGP